MAHSYVFVDVETTGFDPGRDRLIEIAAVAYEDGEIVDRCASLIKPHCPIPEVVTQVTNITEEMVVTAPELAEVQTAFKQVVADRIVVGHNVQFDMKFLQANRLVSEKHPMMDTLTLAGIIMPGLGRYKLEYLVELLELPQTVAHRAEDDAIHSLNLYKVLLDRAVDIEQVLLEEIIRVGLSVSWTETPFFEDALQLKAQAGFSRQGKKKKNIRMSRLFNVPEPEGEPLVPIKIEGENDPTILDEQKISDPELMDERTITPVDAEMAAGLLRPGSNFSAQFPYFEPRPQQIEMVERVSGALNDQENVLIEAGTGTGKSMAYLIPSTFWAVQNDRRVVISTNTINLQDQLLNKDIPILQKALPLDVRVAARKGKSNYLCARLFRELYDNKPEDMDEMTLYARLVLWLPYTETGEVSELTLRTRGERDAWRKLSGENAPCTTKECAEEGCPLHIARRKSEIAHLLIVNHALLLSDVANNHHILPVFKDVVIDEAHHLESAVTQGLSFQADEWSLKVLLNEIIKDNGVMVRLKKSIGKLSLDVQDDLIQKILSVQHESKEAMEPLEQFFKQVIWFARDYIKTESNFSQSVRLTKDMIEKPSWQNVKTTWDNLSGPLKRISKAMGKLTENVADLVSDNQLGNVDGLRTVLSRLHRTLEQSEEALTAIVYGTTYDQSDDAPSEIMSDAHGLIQLGQDSTQLEMINWVGMRKGQPSLHSAPLHVGPLVQDYLFGTMDSVIMTSATLRTAPNGRYANTNFDYVRERLSAPRDQVQEFALGSPFDYKKNTLLYLCTDIAEPSQPGYQRQVEQAIIDAATTLGGRTLVLFTSYTHLRKTAEAIEMALAKSDIQLLVQGGALSRQQLSDQFRAEDARAVLLGTRSFWEGVDIPGKALSAVIIARIPFDVPSDPIIGARSETFGNPFYDYSIPEAVLRFRQGFGRLIRRTTDEGVVIVLDKRVLTKRYGEQFLDALPETTLLRQKLGRISEIIERWENRAR